MAELPAAKEVAVSASPSILYNNLATIGADHLAYVHCSEIHVVRPLGPHKLPLKDRERAFVTSMVVCKFQGRPVLIATANHETIVWDAQKELQMAVVAHSADEETRGVAGLDMGQQLMLAIGHGTGEVEFAIVGLDHSVQVVNRQKAHRGAITAVAASPNNPTVSFASGDTNGEVHLWNAQTQAYVGMPTQNDSVSAIEIVGNWVVVAYGSGAIRMFNGQTGLIRFDVGAHSRWITAMAFSPINNLLATVAEDNLLCLFRLIPSATAPKIEFVGHKLHPNRLPTGVQFSEDGKSLTISVYDSEKLLTYTVG